MNQKIISSIFKNLIVISLVLLFGLILAFILIIRTVLTHLNFELDTVVVLTNSAIHQNRQNFDKIFTIIFDEAKECKTDQCRKQISDRIHQNLESSRSVPFYEGTYFIRIKSKKKIEKLFLHGEWKEESVDTDGEIKVYNFLRKANSRDYLRGIRINEGYSDMRYLNDFYSEAEIVMPYRIDDKIVGAIVKVYGD